MSKIRFGTNYVLEDEPCLGLAEKDIQSPNYKGFHRYRIVEVMRNGTPTQYRKDLGQSSNFKGVDSIAILGGWQDGNELHIEHTVGELIEIAEALRAKKQPFDKKELTGLDKVNQ